MEVSIAESFLRCLGSKKFDRGTLPWLTGQCPLARWTHEKSADKSPSFGVLTGHKFKPRCHCFSCNFSGSPEALLGDIMLRGGIKDHEYDLRGAQRILDEQDTTLIDLSKIGPQDDFDQPDIPFPEKFWSSFAPVEYGPGFDYLLEVRKLPINIIREYDFRWDGHTKRVCLPIRGFDKRLYGIRGRAIAPGGARYFSYPYGGVTNPQVWYGEEWVDMQQPIAAVESVFDVIAARRAYRNVLAPLSSGLTRQQAKRVRDGFLWLHIMDADKAGKSLSRTLKLFLPHAKHTVYKLPAGEDPDSFVKRQGVAALYNYFPSLIPSLA